MQLSYQIQIYDDSTMTNIVYDSGVKVSEESQRVVADGFSMLPSTRYYWRVTVRDTHGEEASSSECAYFDSGLMGSGWSGAKWIMESLPRSNDNGMSMFRKLFEVDKPIKKAFLYSSALGIYDLFCNGKRIGHTTADGIKYEELKPGWTDYRKSIFYQVHEVSSYLNQGKNVLGSIVSNGWWKGGIAFEVYGKPNTAFIAKMFIVYEDNTTDVVVSDESWNTSCNGPLRNGDIYDGEVYDARLENNWQKVDYDISKWHQCAINNEFVGKLEVYSGANVYALTDMRRIPSVKICDGIVEMGTDYGKVNVIYENNTFTPIKLNKGQSLICDFGQNIVGWTPFKVKGESGTQICVRYAEMLNDTGSKERGNDGPGGKPYYDNLRAAKATLYYTLRGDTEGESYCSAHSFYGFRYCEIISDGDVIVETIDGMPISSSIDDTGFIVTNNNKVNQLISNIKWGQRGNILSVPTDCPQRDERHGWTGDAQAFCRTACYNTDLEPFYWKYLKDLRDSQMEDGSYTDVAPFVTRVGFGNAGWADAGIIIPWNLYLMFGNKELLSNHYASMEKYMNWLSTKSGDGYKYQGAETAYGDWLAYDKCSNRYVSVAYYANDALIMSKISQALSSAADDEYAQKSNYYYQLFEKIKVEFLERYWNPFPSETTQTTYLLPLAFNLLDEKKEEKAIELLKERIKDNNGLLSTGFLGTSLFLPTLSKHNLNDEAYSLLLQDQNPSWLYSVDQGATTIWERWDSYTKEKGFGPSEMNSFNHYAYGSVGEWLYRYMAGIEVDENSVGFKHVILQPNFDHRTFFPKDQEKISKVDSHYSSRYGHVISSWDMKDGSYSYFCSVPVNTTATVYLPSYINDSQAIDVHVDEEEGVHYLGLKKNKHVFNLASGDYHFNSSISTGDNLHNFMDNSTPNVVIDNNHIIFRGGGKCTLQLYDYKGVINKTYEGENMIIDISNLRAGCYILAISNKDFRSYRKIIRK